MFSHASGSWTVVHYAQIKKSAPEALWFSENKHGSGAMIRILDSTGDGPEIPKELIGAPGLCLAFGCFWVWIHQFLQQFGPWLDLYQHSCLRVQSVVHNLWSCLQFSCSLVSGIPFFAVMSKAEALELAVQQAFFARETTVCALCTSEWKSWGMQAKGNKTRNREQRTQTNKQTKKATKALQELAVQQAAMSLSKTGASFAFKRSRQEKHQLSDHTSSGHSVFATSVPLWLKAYRLKTAWNFSLKGDWKVLKQSG